MEALLIVLALAAIASAVGAGSSSSPEEPETRRPDPMVGDFRPIGATETTNRAGVRCWVCGRENDGHKH